MKKTPQFNILHKRVFNTLVILLVYMLGSSIPLPFAVFTSEFNSFVNSSSMGLLGALSGANLQHLSILMIGLTPFMIAMMVVQLLSLTRLFGFNALSMNQVAIAQQIFTLILTILQATVMTVGFHLTDNFWRALAIVIMLTAGGMFVVWLGVMNMQFGIGSTITIILFNIISSSIPLVIKTVKRITKMPNANGWLIGLTGLVLVLMLFWINFNHTYYPLKVIQITLPSYEKPITIPLGLNLGAMMTYMVGMALLVMPTMLVHILGKRSLFSNIGVEMGIIGLLAIGLFYFFSFVMFDPREQAKELRNSNSYIPGIRPGKPTQRYIRHLMFIILFPGAILNAAQLIFGLGGQLFLGKYADIAVILMNVVMIVMIISGVEDAFMILFFPGHYRKITEREIGAKR